MDAGQIGEPWPVPYRGKWQGRVKYGAWDGVRREATATAATRNEAKRAAVAKASRVLGTRRGATGERVTLATVADSWLASQQARGLAPSTTGRYRAEWRRHLLPTGGAILIQDLATPASALRLLAAVRERGITSHMPRVTLEQILLHAVHLGHLDANPLAGYREPLPRKARRPVTALTLLQAVRLLGVLEDAETAQRADTHPGNGRTNGNARSTVLRHLVLTILSTGLRVGEVCALRWRDLDLDSETPMLLAHHSVMQPIGTDVPTRDPDAETKREASDRIIVLPDLAVRVLRERRKQTRWRRLDDLVFAREKDGLTMPYSTLRSNLQRPLVGTDVEGATFHLLRRTVATEVASRGRVEDAQALLGHALEGTTLKHYIADGTLVNDARTTLGPLLDALDLSV